MRRAVVATAEGIGPNEIASRTRYVGSAEHKSYPSFAGPPKLRADATKCDPTLIDAGEITDWLRDAIRAGHIGSPWEGEFPRYVWHRVDGVCYEGRLVNRDLGEYEGYPLDEAECPAGL